MAARNSCSPLVRSPNLQFFLARAAECKADGDAATLDQVRARCRRSEAAWRVMAERASRVELMLAETTALKRASSDDAARLLDTKPSENPDRGCAD